MLLQELLPPGQLATALSPACPHKDEKSLAKEVCDPNRLAIHPGQRQSREPISDGQWLRYRHLWSSN
jgi:hypothetical protein